jgi:hypothetical protein
MGSASGPLFANVFISHFERKHMERMKELGLKTWMRFVDDIHATVGDKGQAIVICMFLNEQHQTLSLQSNTRSKTGCHFLIRVDTRPQIQWIQDHSLQQRAFTGVYLNWNSLTARRYKISLIRCLAERIWRTVSNTCERMTKL